jgi:hypothetical protein
MANTIDAPKSNLDKAVRVFDSYYNFDMVVGGNEYDIVLSYFMSVSNSKTIASNFTTMMFRIANITGENVLDLLSYMQGKNKIEASAIMIYYLNSLKSKTSLYGISVIPQPNTNVQRNVVL